jgi:hypothetical protein
MSEDYQGSIAQKNVTFITQTVVSTVPGANYNKIMIFVGDSQSATYFTAAESPAAGYAVELDSTNYDTVTQGKLKDWLADFFGSSSVATAWVVVYDDLVESVWNATDLGVQYDAYKTLAFFKLCIYDTEDADLALAALIKAEGKDKKLSQQWIGTSDSDTLDKEATDGIVYDLNQAGTLDPVVVYHYDTDRNPALVQLGETLAIANVTGVFVGNSMDYLQTNKIDPSGTDGENLGPDEYGDLEDQNVGYFTYVGNGTTYVALQGGFNLNGDIACAFWVKSFIEYVCEIKSAELITQLNKYRNNDTYQSILLILQEQLNRFTTLGRFIETKITAPVFSALTVSGDTITIPNAWQANYVDNLREATVYGTLYIVV